MNKKYKWTKKEISWFKKKVEEYKEKLNMNGWRVVLEFASGEVVADRYGFIEDATSSVTNDYEYIKIIFKPSVLREYRSGAIDYVETVIKHELIHGLVDEISDIAQRRYINKDQVSTAMERLVQRFAMII